MTGNLLHGWRVEEYGRSRDGVALRAFFPEGNSPTAGLLVAAQHGEEAVTALLARRLLERVSGDATRWVVVPVANPDGLINGTRQNAAGVDLNRNFPAATWRPEDSFTYPPGSRTNGEWSRTARISPNRASIQARSPRRRR